MNDDLGFQISPWDMLKFLLVLRSIFIKLSSWTKAGLLTHYIIYKTFR